MIAVCIPISESKCYCFHDFARGLVNLDYPKEELQIVFALDSFCASSVVRGIEEFQSRWPIPDAIHVVSTNISSNNPNSSDVMPWQTRAEIAARLRNLYFNYVKKYLNTDYIFSLGSDIILSSGDLSKLLENNHPLVSGLYISRIQNKPLALYYRDKEWGYLDVDLNSQEPIEADWSGLDCALMSREVYNSVDFTDYSLDKYGLGEDGYFYLEAAKNGYKLLIDLRVRPLHANFDGKAFSADPLSKYSISPICPSCGWETIIGKIYKDITLCCPNCKTEFNVDPFWKEANRVNCTIEDSFSIT